MGHHSKMLVNNNLVRSQIPEMSNFITRAVVLARVVQEWSSNRDLFSPLQSFLFLFVEENGF